MSAVSLGAVALPLPSDEVGRVGALLRQLVILSLGLSAHSSRALGSSVRETKQRAACARGTKTRWGESSARVRSAGFRAGSRAVGGANRQSVV